MSRVRGKKAGEGRDSGRGGTELGRGGVGGRGGGEGGSGGGEGGRGGAGEVSTGGVHLW